MNREESFNDLRIKQSVSLFDYFRMGIAFLILYSAVMKGWELSTVPVLGNGLLYSRWFNALVVIGELGFGLCLLTKFLPRLKWLAMISLFTIFTFVSAYEWFSGASRCTCFGSASIPPLWTFGIDVAIVVCLAFIQPPVSENHMPKQFTLYVLGAVWVLAVSVFLLGFYSVEKRSISSLGTEVTGIDGRKTISLLPEMWNGTLPILGFLEPAETRHQLEDGEWTVVFYHHDCPKCQKVIADLAPKGITSVVCIEVPPFGKSDFIPEGFLKTRLTTQWEWSVETPLVIKVKLSYR